jgi:hypothetical protein
MEIQITHPQSIDSPQNLGHQAAQANDQRAERHAERLSRVLDYQAQSLAKEDALEANLGSINSGLMRVVLWLDQIIEEAIEIGPLSVEYLQTVLPAIDTHLRVTRQVDRFAQIEQRAAAARQSTAPNDKQEMLCLDAHQTLEVIQSEVSEV